MAKKPNFKAADEAPARRDPIDILTGAEQEEQDAQQEQQEPRRMTDKELQEALATRGHKGVKMPRINLAFKPSLLDYLRVMAAIRGLSITQYINQLVEADKAANADTYAQALRLTGKDL